MSVIDEYLNINISQHYDQLAVYKKIIGESRKI